MKLRIVIRGFLTALTIGGVRSWCPPGWIGQRRLGCFYFATEAKPMTWAKSKIYCGNLAVAFSGAWLAEVYNADTHAWLSSQLRRLPEQRWWLGANDIAHVTFEF